MRRLFPALLATALVLGGCTSPAGPAAPSPAVPAPSASLGKPVAAVVEFEVSHERASETREIARIDLAGRITGLPISPYADTDVAVSADARQVLYSPASSEQTQGYEFRHSFAYPAGLQLRSLDVSSGLSRTLLPTTPLAYGYDTAGDVVALTGAGGMNMRYASMSSRPGLTDVQLVTLPRGGEASRSVSVSGFTPDVGSVRFLAADGRSVYLLGTSYTGMNASPNQSLWSCDRSTGRASSISRFANVGSLGSRPGDRADAVHREVSLPSAQVIRLGLPLISDVETSAPGPDGGCSQWVNSTGIDVRRLPGLEPVRSLPVTQPAGVQAHVGALAPDASRYLVTYEPVAAAPMARAILERGSASAEGTLVVSNRRAPYPEPIGYVGDDVLWQSSEDSHTTVWLWDRATRKSHRLGSATPSGSFLLESRLLGVEYER
jgi:hypothetical protein